ncbi:hypothetical protein PGB28_12135 [Primorskyibacter aestuariivivens]|uniref:hypothetical protein n=1 Tax=Primorskyibacter aestuariivivens TaxID=1888912 RepID=UPI002301858F|nr:hypothetical protein [Primorskyibacter aestuariivivens]MDA7429210.1 hypothetical protein [Primorskyibacter aestuariivivens]
MMGRVWILGGTGKVATELTGLLAPDAGETITISRHPATAGHGRTHVQMDLSRPLTLPAFRSGDRIINLTEATSPSVVAAAIKRGAIFIDTSATIDYVKSLRDAASDTEGAGQFIGCVGMAPGLSNLMAHRIVRDQPGTRHLKIASELGLGEHAGTAATQWFFKSLETTGKSTSSQSFKTGQKIWDVAFDARQPKRLALNFPFVEREILAEELSPQVETVETYLALSPSWVTQLLLFGLRLGFGGMLAQNAHMLTKLALAGPTFGSATTRIVARGTDAAGQTTGFLRLATGEQSRATAAVIAAVARRSSDEPMQRITTIADWVGLEAVVNAIRQACPGTVLSSGAVQAADPTAQAFSRREQEFGS